MTRTAIAAFALLFACGTAALAQYDERSDAGYGAQDNGNYPQRDYRDQGVRPDQDTQDRAGYARPGDQADETYQSQQDRYAKRDRYDNTDRDGRGSYDRDDDRYADRSYDRQDYWSYGDNRDWGYTPKSGYSGPEVNPDR